MASILLFLSGMWNADNLKPTSPVASTPEADRFERRHRAGFQDLSPERLQDEEPVRRLQSAGPQPTWQLFSRLMKLVVQSTSSSDRLHRVVAGLGLLPPVLCTSIQDQPTHAANVLQQSFEQDQNTRWLIVELDAQCGLAYVSMIEEMLRLFADLYQQARYIELVMSEALTDPLTGLWNRRGFDPLLEQAVARWRRTGERIALLAIDVDYFKQINDNLGHDAGDQALELIAQTLQQTCRPCDIVARLGGDELVVLLGGCDAQGAAIVAQRVQAKLSQTQPHPLPPLSLSIGVADASSIDPRAEQSPARQLLKAADRALYEVKRRGRGAYQIDDSCADLGERWGEV